MRLICPSVKFFAIVLNFVSRKGNEYRQILAEKDWIEKIGRKWWTEDMICPT